MSNSELLASVEAKPQRAFPRAVSAPSSKPETQRTILIAALAEGTSTVVNDLRCEETETMVEACRNLGARFDFRDDRVHVTGIGGRPAFKNRFIQAYGSGLVFRCFTALASVSTDMVALTGDKTLRARVMRPLFEALEGFGATIIPLAEDGHAPILAAGTTFNGGSVSLPGNISSQFITALLLAAPFAKGLVEIRVAGELLSASYIRQTLWAMKRAGIDVQPSDDLKSITVSPGRYRAVDTVVLGDFTSLSYIVAACALTEGTTVVHNVPEESLQGESEIIQIARTIGLDLTFDDGEKILTIVNDGVDVLRGNFSFDVSDCPNIVPTLAAIGAFVDGSFTVTGGSITRLHKSPRIHAMITELKKLGVAVESLHRDDVIDGFTIKGNGIAPSGGIELEYWNDHRIFMSLYIVSARCRTPNRLAGAESVISSFPNFINAIDSVIA